MRPFIPLSFPNHRSGHKRGLRRFAYIVICFFGITLFPFSFAYALTVGEVQVQSALDEPLNITIPVTLSGLESMDEKCVRIDTAPRMGEAGTSDLPMPKNYRMVLSESPPKILINITTPGRITTPTILVRLRLTCRPNVFATREFTIHLPLPNSRW